MRTHKQIIVYESILQALPKDRRCSQPTRYVRASVLAARVDTIIDNYRKELTREFKHLRDEPEQDSAGWGALGRAAEFFVSQCGLHS